MAQICQLAVDVSGSAAVTPGGTKFCEETRHMALLILEAVERNGILPPWQLIPPLVALVTDPSRYID